MLVSAGSISMQATSPSASSRSSPSRSLISTTRVVSATSTPGPTLPSRGRTSPSTRFATVSSTLPW